MIVNAHSIAQHVIKTKNRIIKIVSVKKIIVGILAHAFMRIARV